MALTQVMFSVPCPSEFSAMVEIICTAPNGSFLSHITLRNVPSATEKQNFFASMTFNSFKLK